MTTSTTPPLWRRSRALCSPKRASASISVGESCTSRARPTAPWFSPSSNSRIDIFEADGVAHTLDPTVGASYIGNPESIIIRPHLNAHTAFNQRALVHEATHAVQDDQLNGEWVWRLDDEATAYIAEWLFVIHASPNPDRLISKPDPDDPIEAIAFEIAQALADKPGASPDAAAMRRLGDAIFHDPTYSVTMALHPWIRDDGVTKPDVP